MKLSTMVAGALIPVLMALNVHGQTIAGTALRTYNSIPQNEGTHFTVPLTLTKKLEAGTTTNLVTGMIELPAGRDLGMMVNGFIITNNAQFTIYYRLSPNGVNWSWPPNSISSGVVASNQTPAFSLFLVLSNSVTYPNRYVRLSSVTVGTNSCFISNAVFFYKNNR